MTSSNETAQQISFNPSWFVTIPAVVKSLFQDATSRASQDAKAEWHYTSCIE
jgi:hypothetical protein